MGGYKPSSPPKWLATNPVWLSIYLPPNFAFELEGREWSPALDLGPEERRPMVLLARKVSTALKKVVFVNSGDISDRSPGSYYTTPLTKDWMKRGGVSPVLVPDNEREGLVAVARWIRRRSDEIWEDQEKSLSRKGLVYIYRCIEHWAWLSRERGSVGIPDCLRQAIDAVRGGKDLEADATWTGKKGSPAAAMVASPPSPDAEEGLSQGPEPSETSYAAGAHEMNGKLREMRILAEGLLEGAMTTSGTEITLRHLDGLTDETDSDRFAQAVALLEGTQQEAIERGATHVEVSNRLMVPPTGRTRLIKGARSIPHHPQTWILTMRP